MGGTAPQEEESLANNQEDVPVIPPALAATAIIDGSTPAPQNESIESPAQPSPVHPGLEAALAGVEHDQGHP